MEAYLASTAGMVKMGAHGPVSSLTKPEQYTSLANNMRLLEYDISDQEALNFVRKTPKISRRTLSV